MPDKLTAEQFAAKIRERRPDLANIPTNTLVGKTLAAAPELKQFVDLDPMSAANRGDFQSPVYGPTGPTAGQVAQDQATDVLRGIPQAVTGIPGALKAAIASSPYLGNRPDPAMGQALAEPFTTIGKGAAELAAPGTTTAPPPQAPEWSRAAQFSGAMLGGAELPNVMSGMGQAMNPLARALRSRFPSEAGAGTKFQQVMGAAKDVPLKLSEADDVALRALEMGGRGAKTPGSGSSLPKVFADYIRQREANPLMTYQTGRDFAVNAGRLSAAETQAANPVMQRQVALFAQAMKDANRAAATQAGMGSVYDAAMKEFAKAATNAERLAIAAKWGKRAAIAAGLGTAGSIGFGVGQDLSR